MELFVTLVPFTGSHPKPGLFLRHSLNSDVCNNTLLDRAEAPGLHSMYDKIRLKQFHYAAAASKFLTY